MGSVRDRYVTASPSYETDTPESDHRAAAMERKSRPSSTTLTKPTTRLHPLRDSDAKRRRDGDPNETECNPDEVTFRYMTSIPRRANGCGESVQREHVRRCSSSRHSRPGEEGHDVELSTTL